MKTIFWSVSVTLATVTLAASLFLNTILGVFGLAATSVETLQQLRSSQQVVEQLKHRHQKRKASVSKQLVKRSSKRIGATALAAATVGTVAVAATMVGLEVADYCEERQSLHETESILYGADEAFDMKQCIDEGKEELGKLLIDARDASIEAVINAFTLQDDAAEVIHE